MSKKKKDDKQVEVTDNFHKMRIFIKSSILCVLHLNPLYFFIALFCFEISAISIDYFVRKTEKPSPKVEFLQHIFINVTLGMIISVPNSILALIVVSALIVTVIILDIYINCQEPDWIKSQEAVSDNKNKVGIYDLRYDATEVDILHKDEKKIDILGD